MPPYLPPLILVSVWFGLIVFFSWVSGWRDWARKYPGTTKPTGIVFTCRHAMLGGVSYKNGVRVVFIPEGIYLFTNFFLPFHPPLLLPWDKVTGIVKNKFLWLTRDELKIYIMDNEMSLGLSQQAKEACLAFRPGLLLAS